MTEGRRECLDGVAKKRKIGCNKKMEEPIENVIDTAVANAPKKKTVILGGAIPVVTQLESQWAVGGKILAETTEESLDQARLRVLEAGKKVRQKGLLSTKK